MSKVLGVIPARYGSTRFPGKVLVKIGSKSMIQWVYEAALKCPTIDKLVVATDDERVREAVLAFGGEVIITSENHKTGTDRVKEVAELFPEYDVIINIQGDEPGIEPELITGVLKIKMDHPEWEVATAARPFQDDEDPLIPNRVKVVITRKKRAIYFSRSLIPFPRNKTQQKVYLHLGIYAYQRDFLMHFNTLPASGLEDTESLEQLRVIENDYNLGVHIVEGSLPGVDTPEDMKKITELFKQKKLI
jgi:3-deoxy-manno-octulosonate cytidylyltransferase (CMP-KDO synthetase)